MATLARRKALALVGPATEMEYPSTGRYIAYRLPMNGFGRRITRCDWRLDKFNEYTRKNTDKYEIILGLKYSWCDVLPYKWFPPSTYSAGIFLKNVDTRVRVPRHGTKFRWQLLPVTEEDHEALENLMFEWGTYFEFVVPRAKKWHHASVDTLDNQIQSKWSQI